MLDIGLKFQPVPSPVRTSFQLFANDISSQRIERVKYYMAYRLLYRHMAMSRSLVKLTEIGTSWGCGVTVTQKLINIAMY